MRQKAPGVSVSGDVVLEERQHTFCLRPVTTQAARCERALARIGRFHGPCLPLQHPASLVVSAIPQHRVEFGSAAAAEFPKGCELKPATKGIARLASCALAIALREHLSCPCTTSATFRRDLQTKSHTPRYIARA